MFLNEQFIVSIDTAEDVVVLLPVLNTEINVMCDPPLLHVFHNTVCNVINEILFELAGTTVDSLPHSSTVSQCVYELGIISDIQVSEVMYANENLTLSWDSTTVDGTHINELHISVHTVPLTSYVLL